MSEHGEHGGSHVGGGGEGSKFIDKAAGLVMNKDTHDEILKMVTGIGEKKGKDGHGDHGDKKPDSHAPGGSHRH